MKKYNALILMTLFISGVCYASSSEQSTATTVQLEPVRDISNMHIDGRLLGEAVASRTLTWLTGSSANNDYISVGRIANYFGFVALRVASGQSITRSAVANDTLAILNDTQRQLLVDLLEDQQVAFKQTQSARYEINRALEGLLIGESIAEAKFLDLGRAYGASEAELGRVIAQRLGDVAQSLSEDQTLALRKIRAAHISGHGHELERKPFKLKLAKEDKQELVNIAARFLSWTTGTTDENDFEVVGKPSQHFGFVSLRTESNHGVKRGEVAKQVVALLSSEQNEYLQSAAAHDAIVFVEFLKARGQLMRSLEVALMGETIDVKRIEQLGAEVGALEASMTWAQAGAMLLVKNNLSADQSVDLLAMRSNYAVANKEMLYDNLNELGRQLFAQCTLCHDTSRVTMIAPDLTGIVGRKVANDASFSGYSHALRNYAASGSIWSEQALDKFLASPKDAVPGTSMGYTGLEDSQSRAALIAYLKQRTSNQ